MSNIIFNSEINEQDDGLTVELWNRGMLWDKLLGVHWLRLINIKHSDLPDVRALLFEIVCEECIFYVHFIVFLL